MGPSGTKKILTKIFELYKRDFDDSLRGIVPGQWSLFILNKSSKKYWGYINPHVDENRPCAYLIEEVEREYENPWDFLENKLEASLNKRNRFSDYKDNSRLVYGHIDDLPGLIADSYVNCIIIQINTAGMDSFRQNISSWFEEKFPNKQVILLDNEKYRKGESLPSFEITQNLPSEINILENNLRYSISMSKKQKVGYYYDHRINRRKAAEVTNLIARKDLKALDLFCYIGSWGMNLLCSNVESVEFVDQGDFEDEIKSNLKLNDFENRGNFVRKNVFNYLKENKEKAFDVICSDPPAFCKSKKEKRRAIDGYTKLHRGCLSLLNKDSIFIACSCTHYVSHEEFQTSVAQAANSLGRKIQLIDIGMQGYDHPIKSTYTKESYLKYYAYYVE